MKNRLEVNENGEFFIKIPLDIAEEFELDEDDLVTWEFLDDKVVELTFA